MCAPQDSLSSFETLYVLQCAKSEYVYVHIVSEWGRERRGESPSKISNNNDKHILERNIKYLFLINLITIGMPVVPYLTQ